MDPSPHIDHIPHVDQICHMDQSPHMNIIVLTCLFRREDLRIMDMCIILQIIMFISPRRISLLTLMLTLIPLMWNKVEWHLFHLSLMELAEWWTLCHPFRCGWWRKGTNLLCRDRSPDALKRLKNLLETYICLKGRKLIMKKWTFISHILILFYLFNCLMKLIWWIWCHILHWWSIWVRKLH